MSRCHVATCHKTKILHYVYRELLEAWSFQVFNLAMPSHLCEACGRDCNVAVVRHAMILQLRAVEYHR